MVLGGAHYSGRRRLALDNSLGSTVDYGLNHYRGSRWFPVYVSRRKRQVTRDEQGNERRVRWNYDHRKSDRTVGAGKFLKHRASSLARQKDQAIGYAETRACFRSGEIRVLDSNGTVERIIPFDETGREL